VGESKDQVWKNSGLMLMSSKMIETTGKEIQSSGKSEARSIFNKKKNDIMHKWRKRKDSSWIYAIDHGYKCGEAGSN